MLILYRYFSDITKFVNKTFGEESGVNLKEISFFLASIIEQKYMNENDIKESGFTKADSLIYYNWLYKYSHTKLVNLFRYSPISFLYEHFYNHASELVLENEPALTKNKRLYAEIMHEFLMIFKGEINITSIID